MPATILSRGARGIQRAAADLREGGRRFLCRRHSTGNGMLNAPRHHADEKCGVASHCSAGAAMSEVSSWCPGLWCRARRQETRRIVRAPGLLMPAGSMIDGRHGSPGVEIPACRVRGPVGTKACRHARHASVRYPAGIETPGSFNQTPDGVVAGAGHGSAAPIAPQPAFLRLSSRDDRRSGPRRQTV